MKQPPYTHEQLVKQAQFSTEDLEHIKQRRRDHNHLGFAYQLAFVRLVNRFPKAGNQPDQQDFERDEEILSYVGLQLGLPSQLIDAYSQRRMTLSRHQKRIRKYLGLRRFSEREQAEVEQFIFDEACRLEQSSALLARSRTWLKSRGILEPAEYTLKRVIQTQRQAARAAIFRRIATALPKDGRDSLDALLSKDQRSHSSLYRLKKTPNRPSPGALLRLAQKLEQIEETGILSMDLSWLNNNFQRAVTRYARRCTAFQLRQLLPERRYAALTCFLWGLRPVTEQDCTAGENNSLF